jgi:autotransporter-associated beta strand protein
MKPKGLAKALLGTSAVTAALVVNFIAPSAHAADATWNVDADGTWVTDSNWNPAAAPGSTSSTTNTDTATFGSVITAARTVTVDTNRNISGINFSGNSFAYTLSGGNLLLTSGGTIQTSGAGSNTFVDNVNSAITLEGDYTFTGGSTNTNHTLSIGTTVTSAVSGGTTTLTLNGANTGVAGTNTAANVITGVISNGTSTVAISKSGAGRWALQGANTFSGGVTISAGILEARNNAALGTGTVTLAGGTLQAAGASDITITNNIVAQASTTSTLSSNGRNLTINGNISGSGAINRGAPPTATGVILGGNNSGYTGTFTQNAAANATVRFSNANAGSAGASWVFQNTTAGRTTLDFAGTGTISFGSLTGNGHIQANTSGTKTISAGALGLNDTFSGTLAANGANILALTKVGSGTMTLSGNNTYTGATTVSAGRLVLNSSGAINSASALTVSNGAAFDVSAKGAYTMGTGGTTIGIGATTAGLFDGSTTTAVTLGNALALNFDTASLGATSYNLFDYASQTGDFSGITLTGAITGSLTLTSTDTWTGTAGGYDFSFSEATGVLSVVPEPSAALLGGLGLLGLLRRRRVA